MKESKSKHTSCHLKQPWSITPASGSCVPKKSGVAKSINDYLGYKSVFLTCKIVKLCVIHVLS